MQKTYHLRVMPLKRPFLKFKENQLFSSYIISFPFHFIILHLGYAFLRFVLQNIIFIEFLGIALLFS